MSDAIQCDVLVIGAGVIGLAVAAELSKDKSVVVVESYSKFGQETSSRNSEVIHSGIYYPVGSKKTEWCIAGREKLYEYCERKGVGYAQTGKYVVATLNEEEGYLDKLEAHCRAMDVPSERRLAETIISDEPLIAVVSGLFLPRTGIVDSHQFMQSLENEILERGGTIAYRNKFIASEKVGGIWKTEVEGTDGKFEVESPMVVNAAGLGAAEISNAVLKTKKYEHRYCRGRYFTLSSKYQNKFRRLIYPVPPKDGLGIHITVDLAGQARLGPDVHWCEDSTYAKVAENYDCDWDSLTEVFAQASRRYCPTIQNSELAPSQIGIRPKLFLDGKAAPDFLVENHQGFLHCLGIESPGLTSSLAISEEVKRLLS